jgi:hypothetical protein
MALAPLPVVTTAGLAAGPYVGGFNITANVAFPRPTRAIWVNETAGASSFTIVMLDGTTITVSNLTADVLIELAGTMVTAFSNCTLTGLY